MIGGSARGINQLYSSKYILQKGSSPHLVLYSRGSGLSGFLKNIFSYLSPLVPILKESAKNIGTDLLNSSANILQNLGDGRSVKELLAVEKGRLKKNLKEQAISTAMNSLNTLKGSGGINRIGIKNRKSITSQVLKQLAGLKINRTKKKNKKTKRTTRGKKSKKRAAGVRKRRGKGKRRKKSRENSNVLFA